MVIDIDDQSLRHVGQWPWPCDKLARLVDLAATARVVGIDLLLTEPDRLGDNGNETDAFLAASLRRVPVVLAATRGHRSSISFIFIRGRRNSIRGGAAISRLLRRAQSVRDALISEGVPSDVIEIAYHGANNPLIPTRRGVPSCATGASRSPSAETSFVDDPKCCPVSFLWYLFTIFNRAVRSMLIVVEDDDGVRVLVEELLLDRGYDVITAQTGDEGLDRIRHEPRLSLVITDIRMPGIDGWELARRAMEVRADLKILYITGYPGEQRPDHAPPGPLLRKPWRAGEFYQCLEQLISSGDARRFDPPP